jgi:hypothetical protein
MFDPPYDPATWIPYLEIVARIIEGLAWPVLITVLSIVLVPLLKDVIPRIQKLSARGFEFQLKDQSLPVAVEEKNKSVVADEIEPAYDPYIERTEKLIFSQLSEIDETVKIPRLVRAFSIESMERHFALVYANIFGSQIHALQSLNDNGPISRSDAEKELRTLQNEVPAIKEWDVDKYARFLINVGLIEFTERGFEITRTGRNFLLFLSKYNLNRNRLN